MDIRASSALAGIVSEFRTDAARHNQDVRPLWERAGNTSVGQEPAG